MSRKQPTPQAVRDGNLTGEPPESKAAVLAMQRHSASLRRFLIKVLNSEADADDVLQEMNLRLIRKERREPVAEFPRSYMLMTATNIIRDRWRRQRVRQAGLHIPLDQLEHADERPTADTTLIWRQGLQIVKSALAELKPADRLIFLLHRVEGKTFREISEETGIPLRTVQRRASDALSHCKARLEQRKWFS